MSVRWGRLYRGTPAELALEDAVAALGVPYRTQFPGYMFGLRFFPDFYLPTLQLVIEVDDPSHDKPDKIAADRERTAALEAMGWRVVRCRNEEALNDPRGTVQRLLGEAGITRQVLEETKRKRVADCLPKPRSAPAKARRDSQQAALKAQRARRRKV
jgi:very-short-patch-repair endonuclease